MSEPIDKLKIEVESDSSSAVKGLDSLAASLGKLKQAAQGGLGLTSVINNLKKLGNATKGVDESSASKVTKMAQALSDLGKIGNVKISASVANQLNKIGSALKNISDDDVKRVNMLSQALSTLGSVNLQGSASQVNSMARSVNKLGDTSNITTQTNTAVKSGNKLNNFFGGIKNNAMNVYASLKMGYEAVRRTSDLIGGFIAKSTQYVEDLNLFNASLGKYSEEAQAYAENVGEVLGIDPGQWMRNQGIFNTILTGFGVVEDRAYLMSQQLTQLGYDISSFFNLSYDESMAKLESGIAGELEPLRRIGYDLSVARLQQEAYALGIEKSVSAMNQAEKAELRYHAIMTQVIDSHGDMARTLNAPANQLRILQAQLDMAAREIGNIFIPALNLILPYAIAAIKGIRALASEVARFFGFELPEVDYSSLEAMKAVNAEAIDLGEIESGIADTAADIADSAGDLGDGLGEAAKQAKKLKTYMIGIDELNVLSQPDDILSSVSTGSGKTGKTGSGGSGGSGGASGTGVSGGSGLGIDLPTYDFLGDAIARNIDDVTGELRSKIQGALDSFGEIITVVSLASIGVGLLLVLTGNFLLGIGMIVAGAAMLAATVVKWDDGKSTKDKLIEYLGTFAVFTGLALVGLGLLLTATGNVPVGLGLVIGGIAALAVGSAIFKTQDNDTYNQIKSYLIPFATYGGLAAVGLGMLLMVIGKPLIGLGLVLTGAALLATATVLQSSDNDLKNNIINFLQTFATYGGLALFGLGVIMLLLPGHRLLGLGMMVAGAAAIAIGSADFSDGSDIKNKLTEIFSNMLLLTGATALAIGAVLCLIGLIPQGLGLMLLGGAALTASAVMNPQAFAETINKSLTKTGGLLKGLDVKVSIATAMGILPGELDRSLRDLENSNDPKVRLGAGLIEGADAAVKGDIIGMVKSLPTIFANIGTTLDKDSEVKKVSPIMAKIIKALSDKGIVNIIANIDETTQTQKVSKIMNSLIEGVTKADKDAYIEVQARLAANAMTNLSNEMVEKLAAMDKQSITYQMYANLVGGQENLEAAHAYLQKVSDGNPIEYMLELSERAGQKIIEDAGITQSELSDYLKKNPLAMVTNMAWEYGNDMYPDDKAFINAAISNIQSFLNNDTLMANLGFSKDEVLTDTNTMLSFIQTYLYNEKAKRTVNYEGNGSAAIQAANDTLKTTDKTLKSGKPTIVLNADGSAAITTGTKTFNQMNEYARTVKPYTLNAKDNATKTTKAVADKINSTYPTSKNCTLNATDKTSPTVDRTKKYITDNITQPWYNARLGAENKTGTGIGNAKTSMLDYSQGVYSAVLGATDYATDVTKKTSESVRKEYKSPNAVTLNAVDNASDTTKTTYSSMKEAVKNPINISLQSAWRKNYTPGDKVTSANSQLQTEEKYKMTGLIYSAWGLTPASKIASANKQMETGFFLYPFMQAGWGTTPAAKIDSANTQMKTGFFLYPFMQAGWGTTPAAKIDSANTQMKTGFFLYPFMQAGWGTTPATKINSANTQMKTGFFLYPFMQAGWGTTPAAKIASANTQMETGFFLYPFMQAGWGTTPAAKIASANTQMETGFFLYPFMQAGWGTTPASKIESANTQMKTGFFLYPFMQAGWGTTPASKIESANKQLKSEKKYKMSGYMMAVMSEGYTAADTWTATTNKLADWKKEGYLKSVMASGYTAADTWTAATKYLPDWKKDGYLKAVMGNNAWEVWNAATKNLTAKAFIDAQVKMNQAALTTMTTVLKMTLPGVSAWASGGFPEEGEMFIAREAGPELVGSVGHKTAVANNDQIVAAVSAGVYEAVSAAMSGNKDGGTQDITINLDGEVIYKNQQKIAANKGYNFNQGAFA